MKHSMITRGKSKKRAEDTDKEEQETTPIEEMEMIEEIVEEDAQGAVSYTHLDVYKRQPDKLMLLTKVWFSFKHVCLIQDGDNFAVMENRVSRYLNCTI